MKLILLTLALTGCAQTVIQYPSVCDDDANCKQSLNAKTLSEMGYGDAALELMCKDSDVRSVISECDPS
jgi:hypothetical protein